MKQRTAESVTIGHPDKLCDQISDAILDACLEQDPYSRVAIETMGGHGIVTITGELTTKADVNMRTIAQQVYRECGYSDLIGVQINVVEQSSQISQGVNEGGAGDQGIMVGYACNETPELMPLEVILARKLTRAMGTTDGKAQVTLAPDGKSVESFVTSVCGKQPVLLSLALQEAPFKAARYFCQPNGSWDIGGFAADTGLTGRKLVVDNYGPSIPIGGGAYSGKDLTKVDRSGAYMARKIAVDYLVSRGAREVFVHLAYAIGLAEPVMATTIIDGQQEKLSGYDLRPQAIIEFLDLRKPQFKETAKYGHFGNSFLWDLAG